MLTVSFWRNGLGVASTAGMVFLATAAFAAPPPANGSSTGTTAGCANPPHPPSMPQGATASEEDMKDGHDALQKYVNTLQTYEACIDQLIKTAPPDTAPEVKKRLQENADAAIDAAHQIADIYSIQLRAFKARQ